MAKGYYDHLGVAEWPFTVVPRSKLCTFIAGRSRLREDISTLLTALTRRDTSSIHVLWSWFGAGKTHSLFYLANEVRRLAFDDPPVSVLAAYTEFPKGARSFVDLYRVLMAVMPVDRLVDAFLEVSTNAGPNDLYDRLVAASPDLANAMRVLAIEDDQARRTVAIRWLRGDQLPITEFRQAGISRRIASTDQATLILAFLIEMLSGAARLGGRRGARLVWLIDEYQRLEKAGGKVIEDVNAGIHSLFNACPVGLTPILSFSGPPRERDLPDCFSRELRDRIGATKVLILPPFDSRGALEFIREVMEHYRLQDADVPSPFFPFTEDTCRQIIAQLKGHTDLRPRVLMHAFNAVLELADPLIENGQIALITPDFAHSVLADIVVLSQKQSNA